MPAAERPLRAPLALRLANLSLLVLFPVSWGAPLLRAGLLPWFGGQEISILSGLAVLWRDAPFLALLVAIFAMVAPIAKTGLLALVQWGRFPGRAMPALAFASKLAMADMFLIALYIIAAKGVGVGRVEPAWGLWLFTGCVLGSLALSLRRGRLLP